MKFKIKTVLQRASNVYGVWAGFKDSPSGVRNSFSVVPQFQAYSVAICTQTQQHPVPVWDCPAEGDRLFAQVPLLQRLVLALLCHIVPGQLFCPKRSNSILLFILEFLIFSITCVLTWSSPLLAREQNSHVNTGQETMAGKVLVSNKKYTKWRMRFL